MNTSSKISAAVAQLDTINDLLRFCVSTFNQHQLYYGHGTSNAVDEAFALVFGALKLPFDAPEHFIHSRLTEQERSHLADLIEQRALQRVPVPYLTGEAYFAGLKFIVNPDVLIPRSPLAELIANQFQPWVDPDAVEHILDVCTGSGCIAIACAKAFPDSEVVALDISEQALAVAEQNVALHQLEEQVQLVNSDLLSQLGDDYKFDIIVSNPPYVGFEEMGTLPEEYNHEPSLALAADDQGLALVFQLMQQAASYLKPEGILLVEVGNSQYALQERYPDMPLVWLDFEYGGSGVFLISASNLDEALNQLKAA